MQARPANLKSSQLPERYLFAKQLRGVRRDRVACLVHFAALAATLAIARVLLNTIGTTLFLYHEGPGRLPLFYIILAVVMVVLSFGLSRVIDHMPRIRLAQVVFAGCLLGAAAMRWPIALDAPGVDFVLLASAHIFEIVLDIVLWVVIARFTDVVEIKRATPFIYMSIAIGGAVGGGMAHMLSSLMSTADMLLILPMLAAALVLQLELVGRRLAEIPDEAVARDSSLGIDEATGLIGLVRRFPLSLLIALNALVMTTLYGLSEYLIFTIYSERFPEERELTQFLALVYAALQTIEFGLLYAFSWPLLERTGPLVRNLVFPLTSFVSLLYLVASQKLPAALILHVNAEAVSNAIYQPVSNANYIPLPLRFQGRARTLADGVFYPTGLALAGGILLLVPEQGAMPALGFIAMVFSLIFALLGVGIGFLFLPTLRANVGSGLIAPTGAVATAVVSTQRIEMLLHSRESELRLLGLALAQRLDPSELEDDLHALARRADRVTLIALARLAAGTRGQWVQGFLDRCLTGTSEQEVKLALLVMLIRRTPLMPEHLPRVLGARDSAVVVLGQVLTEGLGAWAGIQPLIRKAEVASDLVDAIACAERTDLTPLLLACLANAEPEQQCRALVMLNRVAGPIHDTTEAVLRRLAGSRDGAVRAEAIVLLCRRGPRASALRELVAALDDPDRHVRGRIAEALCTQGDRATALLRRRLSAVTVRSTEAVWAVARIASPRSRRLLAAFIERLRQDADRTLHLLASIAVSPDPARWSALELCLRDHRACVIDVVIAALSAAIEARLARRLRVDLHSAEQRSRATAFELIAAMPASRLAPGGVALLHSLLFEDSDRRPGSDAPDELIAQAMASMGPWVRRAAALLAARSSSPPPARRLTSAAEPTDQNPTGGREMGLDDQELERIIMLKRTPLFRYVPFETMAEVARSIQSRIYLAGEEVTADSAGQQDLLILGAGMLSIGHPEDATRLPAPACFGEAALVGERVPWPRITAVEDSHVWFLHAMTFQELCHEHPELAIELCKLLARRVGEAAEGGKLTGR